MQKINTTTVKGTKISVLGWFSKPWNHVWVETCNDFTVIHIDLKSVVVNQVVKDFLGLPNDFPLTVSGKSR